jgi:monoamine oxidase
MLSRHRAFGVTGVLPAADPIGLSGSALAPTDVSSTHSWQTTDSLRPIGAAMHFIIKHVSHVERFPFLSANVSLLTAKPRAAFDNPPDGIHDLPGVTSFSKARGLRCKRGSSSMGETGADLPISRRGLLGGSIAVAAGSALSASASAAASTTRSMSKFVDVVVVGGGLSGLAAARDVVAGGKSVVVLEGNNRVGGRTWTKPVSGCKGAWVDMGGQWVGPTQDRILALIKEFGLKTFPFYTKGNLQLFFGNQKLVFPPDDIHIDAKRIEGLPIPAATLRDLISAFKKIDALARTVPPAAPWTAPNATALDSMTVAEWMAANVRNPMAAFILKEGVWGWLASEPRDVSLLHLLTYVSSAGGILPLETFGIAMRVKGGTEQISELMAKQLGSRRVLLEMPVHSITQKGSGLVVSTPNGNFSAQQAIVAMSPTMTSRIEYTPALPGRRDQLTQRVPMGSTIKCHAIYPTPFWRASGLNGQVFSNTTPVAVCADNTPPSGTPGILCAFLEAQPARNWTDKPDAEIKAMVVAALTSYFGPKASKPSQFFIANWQVQPWSRGCFAGVMPTGAWTDYQDAIRQPVGRIHWAGTELASKWTAYMDGAVSSGERAAATVLKLL